jgi:hypothetical protein
MSGLGVSTWGRAPSAATVVTATVNGPPRLNDRVHTPGGYRLVERLCQTPQPFRGFGDGAAICLQDPGRRRGRADDFAAPAEGGRGPGGPAGLAQIVPQPAGFQPQCRGLEVTDGLFTRAAQVAEGFLGNCGDRDGREGP